MEKLITKELIAKEFEERNVELRAPISEMYNANKLAIEIAKGYAQRHNLTYKDIIVIVPNNSWKEFARKELKPDFDAAQILTPYELLIRELKGRRLVDEDQKLLAAYKSLPKAMDENTRIEVAKEMTNALDNLIQQQIDLEVLDKKNFEERFAEFVKNNKTYLHNSYEHKLDETDAKELLMRFRKFVKQYKALKENGYVDFSDLAEEIKPEDKKIVIALNISDLTPLQQKAVTKLTKQSKKVYTSSNDSTYKFTGADPALKQMNVEHIEYYVDTTVFYVPTSNTKPKLIGIFANDEVYAAAEVAKEAENLAIIVPSNYQVWKVSGELERRGVSYTASLLISTNEGTKDDFINFVRGLLEEKDRNIILSALYTPFSPIPLKDVLDHKDEFLAGRNVEAFKPFFEQKEKARNIEGLKELLQEAVKKFEGTVKDVAKIKTAYAMLERLENYDISYPIDLIAWLKSTEIAENYFYKSSEAPTVTVGTQQKIIGYGHFPSIACIISQREGKSISEALIETAMSLSNKSAKQLSMEEMLDNSNAERVFFISKDYSLLRKLQLEEIKRVEGQTERARKPLASELREYITTYLQNLRSVSYSFLRSIDNYLDLYKEILGIKDVSNLIEIGNLVHAALEQEKSPSEVDSSIAKFVENAYILLDQLKAQGYEIKGKEVSLSVPFSEFAKLLGIKTNMEISEAKGKIDILMKKGDEYLIVDYKTGQSTYFDKDYFEQLAFYKLIFAISQGVDPSKIKLAILHIGLRKPFEEGEEATAQVVRIEDEDYKKAIEGLRRKLDKLNYYFNNPDWLIEQIEFALARRS